MESNFSAPIRGYHLTQHPSAGAETVTTR
uniref:Uncharacterized protein n=1 Tax=Arundo donax TaxID=35708 RepID=A0A0A9C2I8_ARUDO